MKTRDILVSQILKSADKEDWKINIEVIYDVLKKDILTEKDKHLQSATYIDEHIIPLASARKVGKDGDPGYYWQKDLGNLQARIDIHMGVADYMASIEATGEDGIYDLTENYIERMLGPAKDEALRILSQQKQEYAARISELEEFIIVLGGETFEGSIETTEQIAA